MTDAVQLELIVQHVIPSSDPIRFFSSDDMGRNVTRGQFIGTLTSLFTSLSDVQRANMTSTLRFVAIGSLDGSLVECRSDTSRVANILQVAGDRDCTLHYINYYVLHFEDILHVYA